MLPELGGPIASGGAVNTGRLQRLLSRLVRDEEPAFKRRAVSGSGGLEVGLGVGWGLGLAWGLAGWLGFWVCRRRHASSRRKVQQPIMSALHRGLSAQSVHR